jgi:hypothetical protein
VVLLDHAKEMLFLAIIADEACPQEKLGRLTKVLQTVRKLPEFGVKQREERAVRESERWASSAA